MSTNSSPTRPSSGKSASPENQGKPQPQSKRFVFTPWSNNEVDHELCAYALTIPPERTPIAGRTGVATAKWFVVEQKDRAVLICNRLHEGPCAWPWAVDVS